MKRKIVVALTSLFVLAFAIAFLPVAGSTVQAYDRCKSFHALLHFALPTPDQFDAGDTWGGAVFGNLGTAFLQGGISGNDGTEYPHGPMSIFKDGLYKVCLTSAPAWGGPSDCLDSFTYKAQAVVIWPAGESLGSYKATAKIVKGTNRFRSASGHLEIEAPFIVWADANNVFGVSRTILA